MNGQNNRIVSDPDSADGTPTPVRNVDDDHLLSEPASSSSESEEIDASTKAPLKIKAILVFHLCLLAVLEVLALTADLIFPGNEKKRLGTDTSFVIYVHVGVFIIHFISNKLLMKIHAELRSSGLLDAHIKTRWIRDVILDHHSFFKVALLLDLSLINDICETNTANCPYRNELLSVKIITSVEVVISAILVVVYWYRIEKYKNRSPLDAIDHRHGFLSESFHNSSYSCNAEVGNTKPSVQDELVDAQAEEIKALKAQNRALSKKIVRMENSYQTQSAVSHA